MGTVSLNTNSGLDERGYVTFVIRNGLVID
jgi:hypothetical protein